MVNNKKSIRKQRIQHQEDDKKRFLEDLCSIKSRIGFLDWLLQLDDIYFTLAGDEASMLRIIRELKERGWYSDIKNMIQGINNSWWITDNWDEYRVDYLENLEYSLGIEEIFDKLITTAIHQITAVDIYIDIAWLLEPKTIYFFKQVIFGMDEFSEKQFSDLERITNTYFIQYINSTFRDQRFLTRLISKLVQSKPTDSEKLIEGYVTELNLAWSTHVDLFLRLLYEFPDIIPSVVSELAINNLLNYLEPGIKYSEIVRNMETLRERLSELYHEFPTLKDLK